MPRLTPLLLSILATSAAASAQDMVAVDDAGDVWALDSATGAGTLIGPLGFAGCTGLAQDSTGAVYAICDNPPFGQALVEVDLTTGAGSVVTNVTALFPSEVFRGLSFDAADLLFAEHTTSYVVNVDMGTGISTMVNKPSAFDMRGIAFEGGTLYGWDEFMGLVTFDLVLPNFATDVNPAVPGSTAISGLTASPGGQLYGAGDALYTIDSVSAVPTLVGGGSYGTLVAVEFLDDPLGPTLSVANLTAGQTATFSVDNVTPFGGFLLGYSTTGAGPTQSPYGEVAMSQPISAFPVLFADATGATLLSVTVPAGGAGRTLYTQGVDLTSGYLSNPLATVVQ
ncbi:MAG: hypothetical protein ACYTF3_03920 [Planctomycetota bacterium]|jgi:hypothetical protein